jgi:glyoxylase-like metal-dependent hydrolase (beta-lactamase superfamily II)
MLHSGEKKHPSIESSELFPGIHRIILNQHVFSYLISGSEHSFLIDTGWGMADLKSHAESLTGSSIIVANTHGHFDHTYGNFQFDRVYLSASDLSLALRGYEREERQTRLCGYDSASLPGGMSEEEWITVKHPDAVDLHDGDIFDIGGRTIEVIATPGHTAGSVCFLDRGARILFSGDSIYRGYLLLHFDTSTDLSVYRDSLKKISSHKRDFDWILPAHGRVPLKGSFAEDVLKGVSLIVKGKNRGERQRFRGTGCLISSFDDFHIVYKDPS